MISAAPTKEIEKTILKTSACLFAENGYQATSLQTIADAVGIGKSALWYYFHNKELILFNIFREAGTAMVQGLEQIHESNGSALEKLYLALEHHLSCLTRFSDELTVTLFEFGRLSGNCRQDVVSRRNRYIGVLSSIVDEAIESGDLRPIDSRLLSLTIVGMSNWIYQWYGPGGLSTEQMASFFWELIYTGTRNTNDIFQNR